jgi:hypothetical protein
VGKSRNDVEELPKVLIAHEVCVALYLKPFAEVDDLLTGRGACYPLTGTATEIQRHDRSPAVEDSRHAIPSGLTNVE